MADFPRPKHWHRRRLISEHAFDKLGSLDCTFAEFERSLERAEIIEEHTLSDKQVKEVVLVVDWTRPLHVVVIVDDVNDEDRVITVYEPDPNRWSADYRRRR